MSVNHENSGIRVRSITPADAEAAAGIYNHYVLNSHVTFETAALTEQAMRSRIAHLAGRLPWLAAEAGGKLLGYAYAAPWSDRPGYRSTAETTIYLHHECRGQTTGSELYGTLLDTLRSLGLHAAVGVIALPNPASVALHEKLGYRKAGVLRQAGHKLGRWVDVGYWQCLLKSE